MIKTETWRERVRKIREERPDAHICDVARDTGKSKQFIHQRWTDENYERTKAAKRNAKRLHKDHVPASA